MDRETEIEAILGEILAGQEEVTCAKAMELASDLDVAPKKITKILNKKKIKVKDCQLGCF